MSLAKYKDVLEANGYTIINGNICNRRGDVVGGEGAFGEFWVKDAETEALLAKPVEPKKPKAKAKAAPKKKTKVTVNIEEDAEEVTLVRARDKKGHFIADDPKTPENEAWVKKVAKKVLKK
jgi:hypothetical protein